MFNNPDSDWQSQKLPKHMNKEHWNLYPYGKEFVVLVVNNNRSYNWGRVFDFPIPQ